MTPTSVKLAPIHIEILSSAKPEVPSSFKNISCKIPCSTSIIPAISAFWAYNLPVLSI